MAKEILLAEDSEDAELLFRHTLESSGVKNPIIVVHDGAEAIAYLSGSGEFADREAYPFPRVLFLDVKMPKADGFSVLKWIQKQSGLKEKMLIIVLTQFGEADQIQRAYDLGANTFLPKPFKKEDLDNLIRHFPSFWLPGWQSGRFSPFFEQVKRSRFPLNVMSL